MPDAYIFNADIYCAACGEAIRHDLRDIPEGWERECSNAYPQGPFSDGGGEADCPQHCGSCGEFLDNPLTGDGLNYVQEAIAAGDGNPDVLAEWKRAYGLTLQLDRGIDA